MKRRSARAGNARASNPARKARPRRAAPPSKRAATLLDAVLETSLAAIAVLRGPDFRYQVVNPAYLRFNPGRTVVGRTYAECWPEAAGQVIPVLRRLLRNGKPVHAEDVRFDLVRIPGGAAEERYFSYTYQRLPPDASGEPGILVATVETTAQVLARRRVQEEGERLRLALEASRAGFWEWDLATGENVWSDALWALYGLARDGRKPSYDLWYASIRPEDRERTAAAVRDAAGKGQPFEIEYRVGPDGAGERWLAARGAPARDESGKVVRYRGVVFDVTPRKQAVRLASERNRFAALEEAVAQLPVGVVLVEAAPDGAPKVVAHNAAYAAITGFTGAAGAPFEKLGHRLYRPDRVTSIPPSEWPGTRAVRHGLATHDEEVHVRRADGTWRVVSLSAAPVSDDDRAVAVLLDLTARKEAEAARSDTEARLDALFHTLPDGVVFQDPSGRIVLANEAACRILGLSLDELTGRTSLDRRWNAVRPDGSPLPGEDHPAMVAVRTGEVVRDAVIGLRSVTNGESRWLLVDAIPVPGPAGSSSAGVYTVFRDVTAQRKAEAELVESRAQLDAALASMTDAVWITDAAGRFVLFNDAFATVHRFGSKAECLRTLAEYPDILECSFPDGTVAPLEQWAVPRALRGEAATNVEYRLRRKDTGESWVGSYSFAPIRRNGDIVGSVAVGRDVTDQKRAEAELRASEARFRDVAASAGEYVFEMDPGGVVTYISDAAEKVLGWRPDEIVGRSSFEFMDPEEAPRSGAFLAEKAARKEPFGRLSQVALHRSGRRVYLEISAVPVLAADGALAGYRGTAMDVTERRDAEVARNRLQEQLAQAQKMEVVGRLAGGVAHDFNNLLTIILTCGIQLLEDLREGRPGDAEQAADVVAAGQRAAELTRQLLAFARREVALPDVVDLNDVVQESRKLLGRVIGEDVRVVVELQEGLRSVRCDRGLLGQVVMNLAVNARDAMPRGGTLRIATANRSLRAGDPLLEPDMAPGDWVEITVRDDGVGMAADVLPHVFEPFYTTKPVGAGTGLGLATVFGIVKQAGGSIGVRSEPGNGTEFRILLPALPAGARERPAPPARDVGGPESILVVEDEPKVREMTTRILRSAGYRVHVMGRGEEALAWLREAADPVDLVVTDVVMPGLAGSALGAAIEALRPGTRMLYVSGFTRDEMLRHGVAGDGLGFLAKPFTPESLRARVRAVLDRP